MLGAVLFLFSLLYMSCFQVYVKLSLKPSTYPPASMNSGLLHQPVKYLYTNFIFYYYIVVFKYLICHILLIRYSCLLYLFPIFPAYVLFGGQSYHSISYSSTSVLLLWYHLACFYCVSTAYLSECFYCVPIT